MTTKPWREIRQKAADRDPDFERGVEQEQKEMDEVELAHLRRARKVSQTSLAGILGTSQANVSRIERQDDLHLSTLHNYVEALGGKIEVRAVFPDHTVAIVSDRGAEREPA